MEQIPSEFKIGKPVAVILGAGGFAREVYQMVRNSFIVRALYEEPKYFKTDHCQKCALPIVDKLNLSMADAYYIIGVADPKLKRKLRDFAENNGLMPTESLVSGIAKVGDRHDIGDGTIICDGSIVTCDVEIGRFVTINLNCTIGHDSIIGDFSSMMPGVHISGNCVLGENVYIGTNSCIREKITIAPNTIIGMGSVVTKNIDEAGTYVGNPARRIR